MRYLPLIILAMLLSACGEEFQAAQNKSSAETKKYEMICSRDLSPHSGPAVYRCENEEAVCYSIHEGTSCKFKQ